MGIMIYEIYMISDRDSDISHQMGVMMHNFSCDNNTWHLMVIKIHGIIGK